MKQLFVSVLVILGHTAFSQNFNLTLKSSVYYPLQSCAGVWGYLDSLGNEYALVGASQGLAIVDVTDPLNPVQVIQIPGPDNKWKEIRTQGKYAFVTNELDSGLQIINLSNLPGTNLPAKYWRPVINGTPLKTIHALEVSNGYLYLHGSNIGSRGTLIVNISDPWNPVYAGWYDGKYVHDGYVRNDTLYAANIQDGYFSVIDVGNKTSPVLLATQNTPMNYTHNTWLSDNSKTLFTTDEKDGSFLASYDISNLNNITELDKVSSFPGPNAILHNVYMLNEWAVTTCNADGINIFDAHRPGNLVLTAAFDTYTVSAAGGGLGVWGGYPYLPSGNILAASRDGYLHILAPNYTRACYLEGQVTDSVTGNPISAASVKVFGTSVVDSTRLTGNYAVGHVTPGIYTVEFSRTGYVTRSIPVTLATASVTALNVKLVPVGGNVNEIDSGSYTTVYPNPFGSSGNVQYKLSGKYNSDAHMVITDLTGRQIETIPVNGREGEVKLNIDLVSGIYILHIVNGEEITRPTKLVKE